MLSFVASETIFRVLIVDDSEINRKMLDLQLRNLGLRNIIHAVDGKQACDIVENTKEPFNIIFMDYRMAPELNGMQTAKKLKPLPICTNTKFILWTSENLASLADYEKKIIPIVLPKPTSPTTISIILVESGFKPSIEVDAKKVNMGSGRVGALLPAINRNALNSPPRASEQKHHLLVSPPAGAAGSPITSPSVAQKSNPAPPATETPLPIIPAIPKSQKPISDRNQRPGRNIIFTFNASAPASMRTIVKMASPTVSHVRSSSFTEGFWSRSSTPLASGVLSPSIPLPSKTVLPSIAVSG